jgi:hypothetical protein
VTACTLVCARREPLLRSSVKSSTVKTGQSMRCACAGTELSQGKDCIIVPETTGGPSDDVLTRTMKAERRTDAYMSD